MCRGAGGWTRRCEEEGLGCVAERVWIEDLSSHSPQEFVGHMPWHFFLDVAMLSYIYANFGIGLLMAHPALLFSFWSNPQVKPALAIP